MTKGESTSDASDKARLKTQIVQHLESYLSPQNLQNDPQLAKPAQEGKINVNALARLKAIKNITTDRQLLLEAIGECPKFQIDPGQSWVHIKKERERTTLILREVPTDTPIEKVKALFEFDDCPEIKEIRSDIGNNWFVSFESEDDCLDVALKLRKTGKFEGKSLKVRVKANLAAAEEPSNFSFDGKENFPAGGGGGGGGYVYPQVGGVFPPAATSPRSPRRGSPRRRGMGYNPAMFAPGYYSPTHRGRAPTFSPPQAQASSDYPGDFRLFTPNTMMTLIKKKYGSEAAPKPPTLDSPLVKDIVSDKPKTMINFDGGREKVQPMGQALDSDAQPDSAPEQMKLPPTAAAPPEPAKKEPKTPAKKKAPPKKAPASAPAKSQTKPKAQAKRGSPKQQSKKGPKTPAKTAQKKAAPKKTAPKRAAKSPEKKGEGGAKPKSAKKAEATKEKGGVNNKGGGNNKGRPGGKDKPKGDDKGAAADAKKDAKPKRKRGGKRGGRPGGAAAGGGGAKKGGAKNSAPQGKQQQASDKGKQAQEKKAKAKPAKAGRAPKQAQKAKPAQAK